MTRDFKISVPWMIKIPEVPEDKLTLKVLFIADKQIYMGTYHKNGWFYSDNKDFAAPCTDKRLTHWTSVDAINAKIRILGDLNHEGT